MRCRFCGRVVWPWQKTLPVGERPVHWHCYSVSMYTLHVMFTQYIEVDKLVRCKKLLMKSWNTGEWLKEDWNKTSLAVDEGTPLEVVMPYAFERTNEELRSNALRVDKTNKWERSKNGVDAGDGTLGLEISDEEGEEDNFRLEDFKRGKD